MFINPKTAIAEGWVTWNEHVTDIEKHIQPNALDFDCAALYQLQSVGMSDADVPHLSETSKQFCKSDKMQPSDDGFWHLSYLHCYDFMSNFHVTLPAGVAAMLIIRSTLNRSGVFLTSGLYDSGFSGNIAGMLRTGSNSFKLAPNTRIGQIIFVRSEDSGVLYAGGYNHSAGTHWSETQQ